MQLPSRDEAIGDSTLIEQLERADVQPERAQTREVVARAPLDDRDVDARQRELARQHQPRRSTSGDHYRMVRHRNSGFEMSAKSGFPAGPCRKPGGA